MHPLHHIPSPVAAAGVMGCWNMPTRQNWSNEISSESRDNCEGWGLR